jgi:error-prone DNA polymerase
MSWSQLDRLLTGRPPGEQVFPGDGGDSPGWSRRRSYRPIELPPGPDGPVVPYAELHCHSNFSFLDGASHPEELVAQAAALGLEALALTDHDGVYGVVRFADAAAKHGLRTVFGVEFSLGLPEPQNGMPDPVGDHLLVLARRPEGYARMCRTITSGYLREDGAPVAGAVKGRPRYDLDGVAAQAGDHWLVLTGCRKGAVRRALENDGAQAAERELRRLCELFGHGNVAVELTDHGLPSDSDRNDALAGLARRCGLPTVATNAAHYAGAGRAHLAAAMAAIRARSSLDDLDGWLPPSGAARLRSGAEMAQRFTRYPGAVARAAEIGRECAFDIELVAPELPPADVPSGHSPDSWLRRLTMHRAALRYGPYDESHPAYRQIEYELAVIGNKKLAGYFLIVDGIVEFCRRSDIYCQGRGSAANSAVCFALGITQVDSVACGLLFERFLAPDRDGYPDIDLDIESDRREEVIQFVYRKYGRQHTAQVANVITYRSRSAVRDVARALGNSPGQQDAWSKQIDRWGPLAATTRQEIDGNVDHDIPAAVLELARQLEGFPRHLGIHSGGMVICDRPVGEVCPVEWARHADRSVLQWDKDDCAAINLVKFDLLGLGMLSALHYMADLVAAHHGLHVDRAELQPVDPAVYEMLQRADSIGVFQVESRAQMATLPRLKPRTFYDLVVEVALIRPGPIQGGSVHPYIRRRNDQEDPSVEHPSMEAALHRTLGVPLFQEQCMQLAIDVAGFTPAEADMLRRALGRKDASIHVEQLRDRFVSGATANQVPHELATRIFNKVRAFANFGFPESHAISFASLVYHSAWFKLYFPAAFCAALLRAQPMGFYSPQSLIADARRHGVSTRGPDVNVSLDHPTLEPVDEGHRPEQPGRYPDRVVGGAAIRLGLAAVRTVGDELAAKIVADRTENGPFADAADLARRVELSTVQAEALATAGAFGCFGPDRRRALWTAGAAAQERPDRLPGTTVGVAAPTLPGMTGIDLAVADVWATGMSPDSFPTQFVRDQLDRMGVLVAHWLPALPDRSLVLVGGAVTHRQRPATAGGVTFINLEDETGMVNVLCTMGVWRRYARIARGCSALLVHGLVENASGVVTVLANRLEPLELRVPARSRDFR